MQHEVLTQAYVRYRTRALTLVSLCFGDASHHYVSLDEIARHEDKSGNPYFLSEVVGLVDAAYADWKQHDDFRPGQASPRDVEWAVGRIDAIVSRFHVVQRALRSRYSNRDTLQVSDEYDVQDLVRSLLHVDFADIRSEEWTPSYAGGSSRVDFLLKEYGVVIEIKRSRDGLSTNELGKQLIVDATRYATHGDCKLLYCFVYDPEGRVSNPRGFEGDLERMRGALRLRVRVRPE